MFISDLGMSVVYLFFFVKNTHSVGPGQAFKVLFHHPSQNSDSGPTYTSELWIERKKERKKESRRGILRLGSFLVRTSVRSTHFA